MSSKTIKTAGASISFLPALSFLIMTGVIFGLFRVASFLTIDYFDSISHLVNARGIASGNALGFLQMRPPMLPLALSPIFYFSDLLQFETYTWQAAHAAMVMMYAALLWVVYRMIRLCAGKQTASLAALLFSLNPVLLHYSPTVINKHPFDKIIAQIRIIEPAFFFRWKQRLRGLERGGENSGTVAGRRTVLIVNLDPAHTATGGPGLEDVPADCVLGGTDLPAVFCECSGNIPPTS